MPIDLDALEVALETDGFGVRTVARQEDEFSLDGKVWRKLGSLTNSQRALYDATVAQGAKVRRVGTPREFLELFSAEEQLAFFLAQTQNPELARWWALASTGDFSLDHPSVATGLEALHASGVLAAPRVAEIRDANFGRLE